MTTRRALPGRPTRRRSCHSRPGRSPGPPARPRPLPPRSPFVVKPSTKRCASASSLKPGPESATESSARSSSRRRVATTRRPPSDIASRAFVTRFSTIRSMRSRDSGTRRPIRVRRDLEHDVVGAAARRAGAACRSTVSVEVGRELRVRCGRAVEQVHHLEHRRGHDHDVRDVLADRVVGGQGPRSASWAWPADSRQEVADVVGESSGSPSPRVPLRRGRRVGSAGGAGTCVDVEGRRPWALAGVG